MEAPRPWTEGEDDLIQRRREGAVSWHDIGVELGRTAGSCRSRLYCLRKKVKASPRREEEKTPQDVKAQVSDAAMHPPVDTSAADRERIRNLESDIALLRQQLSWAQNAESKERTGGLLTVRRSDDHLVDKNHLLSCAKSLTTKLGVVIQQYQPDRIQILAGDDWIAGKGVYKNQDLDIAVSDLDAQLCVGAMKAKSFLESIRSVSDAPIVWRMMRGNHSFVHGESVMEAMFDRMKVLCSDMPNVEFVYHWDSVTANLAAEGTYNVLVRHGFGYSKQSPNGSAFMDAIKDEIIVKHRHMKPEEQYRRVLSGHSHWASVGMERIVGLFFDTTGGLQRNTRIRIGDNQRPVGWIVYVSPRGMDSEILEPIKLTPDTDTYEREIADPHLAQANCDDANECLREYYKFRQERGDFAESSSFGKLNEGRW